MTNKKVIKLDNVKTGFGGLRFPDKFDSDYYKLQLFLTESQLVDILPEINEFEASIIADAKSQGLGTRKISLMDNEDKFPEALKGHNYTGISVKTKVKDKNGNDIIPKVLDATAEIVDSIPNLGFGSTVNAVVTLIPYNYKGTVGISAYLSGLQIVDLAETASKNAEMPTVSFSTTGGSFLSSGPNDIKLT